MDRCQRGGCDAVISVQRQRRHARYCSLYCQQRALKETPEVRAKTLERVLAWQAAHPEQTLARKRVWAEEHLRDPHHLWNRYGLTQQDYERIHQLQKGVCAICQTAA